MEYYLVEMDTIEKKTLAKVRQVLKKITIRNTRNKGTDKAVRKV